MIFKIKMVIEFVGKDNIYVATTINDDIPFCDIDNCPKLCSANLLEKVTGAKINPYENDYLTIELVDTYFESKEIDQSSQLMIDTAYIIYVCRVGEKLPLLEGYKWTEFDKVRPEIDKLRGLI